MSKKLFIIPILFIGIFLFGVSAPTVTAKKNCSTPKVKKVQIAKKYPKRIRVRWKKVKHAKKYQIKVLRKKKNKKNKYRKVKRVKTKKNVKRKYIKKLTPERTYYFRVRAKKNGCWGKYSKRKRGRTTALQDDDDNDDNDDDNTLTCGTSSATDATDVTAKTISNNNLLTESEMKFYVAGYTAREFVPIPEFNTPSGVVVDSNGDPYITALGFYQVSSEGVVDEISSNNGAFYLVIGSDGNFYTDSPLNGNAILQITPTGTVTTLASNVSTEIGMLFNFAATDDGYIYADSNYDGTGISLIKVSISTGEIEIVDNGKTGIKTFGDDGYLYTLDGTSIYKMTSDGVYEEFLCFAYPDDAGSGAQGMVRDSDGNFYLSEAELNSSDEPELFTDQVGTRIFKIDATTSNLTTYADGLHGPRGLALNDQGYLYVTEMSSGSFVKIDPSGNVTTLVQGNLLSNNTDITFDKAEDLVITNAETGLLIKASGNEANSTVEMDTYMSGFNLFTGVDSSYAFTSLDTDSTGNIFVAEYAPDITRNVVTKITTAGVASDFTTNPDTPNGVAVDSSDNVWISNSLSGKIQKYDSSGTFIDETDALSTPSDIAWYDGSLYVAEYGNDRITKVASDFSTSTYVELDSYAVDLAFDSNGDLVVTGGGTLYYIANPGGGAATATTIATYLGNSLEGAVFDSNDNLYLDTPDGGVIKVTGF